MLDSIQDPESKGVWFAAVEEQRLTGWRWMDYSICVAWLVGLARYTSHTRYDATHSFLGDMFNNDDRIIITTVDNNHKLK